MSDGRASFLRAIAQRPSDPLPRLIYADWLDENGDSTAAAFIRQSVSMWQSLLSPRLVAVEIVGQRSFTYIPVGNRQYVRVFRVAFDGRRHLPSETLAAQNLPWLGDIFCTETNIDYDAVVTGLAGTADHDAAFVEVLYQTAEEIKREILTCGRLFSPVISMAGHRLLPLLEALGEQP